jgi:hypothetical protein
MRDSKKWRGKPAATSERHYMNPAYGKAMKADLPRQGGEDEDENPFLVEYHKAQADNEAYPIGTRVSGYAGAESGPFECGNCLHFSAGPEGIVPGGNAEGSAEGRCKHPVVVDDPEVKKDEEEEFAIVEAEGCCNFFRPSPRPHSGGLETAGPPRRAEQKAGEAQADSAASGSVVPRDGRADSAAIGSVAPREEKSHAAGR